MQRPLPSSPPLQPEIPLPVDDIGFRGCQLDEILTAKLGFCFCFADKTLDGGGGERVIRRRVRPTTGVGEGARVIGLGNEVQRRRMRCPFDRDFARMRKPSSAWNGALSCQVYI